MKKIFYALQMITLVSLYTPISLFAANPALVASIYDDSVTRVITISDIEPLGLAQNPPVANISNESSHQVIEVNGVLERLGDEKGEGTTASSSEVITSEEDLANFIKLLVKQNVNLRSVSIQGDTISITREIPAKLFGVLNVPGEETAEVTSWGNGTSAVSVTRPWWSIFSQYATDSDLVTGNLYTRMKGVSPVLLTTSLSIDTKARIIKEIKAAFDENNETLTKEEK